MTSLKSIIAATCIAALPIAMPAHSETYVRPADYVGMGETYYGTTPTSNGAIVETEVGPSRGRLIVNERPVLICELPMYVSEAYALLFGGVPDSEIKHSLPCTTLPTGEYAIIMDTIDGDGATPGSGVAKVRLRDNGVIGWIDSQRYLATKKW